MNLLQEIQALDFPAPLPDTVLAVEQTFEAPKVADIPTAVSGALETSGMLNTMERGGTVAVGVGSRGIANLPEIVRAVVARLRRAGLEPFCVPAMGSHGGATAEGQIGMLANLGVTESSVDAPIRATMEVKEIGNLPDGGPALCQGVDSMAADYAILVSRIKPHTDFRSHLESGPSKMCVIGLGKQHGAAMMHAGGGANFQRYLAPAARVYETNTNFVGAICPIENAYDETAEIVGLSAAEVGTDKEAECQARAKKLMASLPFPEIEVLVVRDLGKNISGTGMDTNIISRLMIPRQPEEFGEVDVAIIAVLDLTEETHGNISGLGLANITTARVFQKTDWFASYTNAITSGIFGMYRSALPITMPDDKRALQAALRGCAYAPESARMVLIRDTLALGKFFVSPSLRQAVEQHPRLSLVGEVPLSFDGNGVMSSPWQLA